jgi:hypothetical protein
MIWFAVVFMATPSIVKYQFMFSCIHLVRAVRES